MLGPSTPPHVLPSRTPPASLTSTEGLSPMKGQAGEVTGLVANKERAEMQFPPPSLLCWVETGSEPASPFI